MCCEIDFAVLKYDSHNEDDAVITIDENVLRASIKMKLKENNKRVHAMKFVLPFYFQTSM